MAAFTAIILAFNSFFLNLKNSMKKEILLLKKSCHSLFAALCVKKEPLGFCASLWFGGFFNQPFSLYSVCCLATVPMTFSWWDHPRSCWRKCTATDHIHLQMRCVCVCKLIGLSWWLCFFYQKSLTVRSTLRLSQCQQRALQVYPCYQVRITN